MAPTTTAAAAAAPRTKPISHKRARDEQAASAADSDCVRTAAAAPAKKAKKTKAASSSSDGKLLCHSHAKEAGRAALIEAGQTDKQRVGHSAVAAAEFFVNDYGAALCANAAKWASHAGRSQIQPADVVQAQISLKMTPPAANDSGATNHIEISTLSVTGALHAAMARIMTTKQPQATAQAVADVRAAIESFAHRLFHDAARYTMHAKRPTMLANDIEAARPETSGDSLVHKLPRGFDGEAKKRKIAKKAAAQPESAAAAAASVEDVQFADD